MIGQTHQVQGLAIPARRIWLFPPTGASINLRTRIFDPQPSVATNQTTEHKLRSLSSMRASAASYRVFAPMLLSQLELNPLTLGIKFRRTRQI